MLWKLVWIMVWICLGKKTNMLKKVKKAQEGWQQSIRTQLAKTRTLINQNNILEDEQFEELEKEFMKFQELRQRLYSIELLLWADDIIRVGDKVVPKNKNRILRSECFVYDYAVVESLEPFVLVSEHEYMTWSCSFKVEDVKKI